MGGDHRRELPRPDRLLQPFDAPDEPGGAARVLARITDQLGSEAMLLFSTDFPHWHFDGADALPAPPAGALARRLLWDNALETFPRLRASSATAPAAPEADTGQ